MAAAKTLQTGNKLMENTERSVVFCIVCFKMENRLCDPCKIGTSSARLRLSGRELAVMNKCVPSRVYHEGLQGAGEGAGAGMCHRSSGDTFVKILLLLWAASL